MEDHFEDVDFGGDSGFVRACVDEEDDLDGDEDEAGR
jgi:hypothetical protein